MLSGPPSLATDAAIIIWSCLHLHKWDRELMAFPHVPVDTLKSTECIKKKNYITCVEKLHNTIYLPFSLLGIPVNLDIH